MIKRSTHSFGAGYANSSIDAVWVAETYAEGMTESEDLAAETNTQSPMKCKMPTKEEKADESDKERINDDIGGASWGGA